MLPLPCSACLEPLLLFLWTYMIHSTLILGGLYLVLRVRGAGAPSIEEALWKVAVLVPIVTSLLQTTAGAPAFAWQVAVVPWSAVASPLDAELPFDNRPGDDPLITATAALVTGHGNDTSPLPAPTAASPETARHGPLASTRQDRATTPAPADTWHAGATCRFLFTALPLGMLASSFAALTALIATVARTWRGFRRCRPMDGLPRRLLDGLALDTKVRRPIALLAGPEGSEPSSAGVWRWRIFVPRDVEARLPVEQVRAVLAHEMAHLVRGDGLWLWLGNLLGAAFAFQPLNRVAVRHWRRAAEFQCDDWAIDRGIRPTHLARCLATVATFTRRPSGLAVLSASGGRGHLSQRIERLVGGQRRPGRGVGWSVVAGTLAMLAVGFAASPIVPQRDAAASRAEEEWSVAATWPKASPPVRAVTATRVSVDEPPRVVPFAAARTPAVERDALEEPPRVGEVTQAFSPVAAWASAPADWMDSVRFLREAVVVLDGELLALDAELIRLNRTVQAAAAESPDGVAVAPLMRSLERLRTRAASIRARRDTLVHRVELLDMEHVR